MKRITSLALSAALLASLSTPVLAAPAISVDAAPTAAVLEEENSLWELATVYKGNIIKNLIMDCQSYTKYRPNETTGGIFVSWRRKEELPTGA